MEIFVKAGTNFFECSEVSICQFSAGRRNIKGKLALWAFYSISHKLKTGWMCWGYNVSADKQKRKNPHSSSASPFNRQTFHLDHFQLSLIIACPSAIPREVLRAEAGCMCVLGLGSHDFDRTPKACRVHIPIQKVLCFSSHRAWGHLFCAGKPLNTLPHIFMPGQYLNAHFFCIWLIYVR